jgi:hypothetical protein
MADKVSKKDIKSVKASLNTAKGSSARKTNKVAGSVLKLARDQRTPSVAAKPKTAKVPVKPRGGLRGGGSLGGGGGLGRANR